MHFLTRVTLTTLVTCTLLGTSAGQPSAWLRLDFRDIRGACARLFHEQQREGNLAQRESTAQARTRHKSAIALALAQRRLPFPQAIADFRDLSNDQPEFWRAVEAMAPSGTQAEKLCRYVIDWMQSDLKASHPELARAAARRLYAELDERLRSGRPLVEPRATSPQPAPGNPTS
jgi:hypothetical protein